MLNLTLRFLFFIADNVPGYERYWLWLVRHFENVSARQLVGGY